MNRISKLAMFVSPLIAGLVINQPVSASAASTTSIVANAKVAYNNAYMNLKHSRYLQMTQLEKDVVLPKFTALGENSQTIVREFEFPPKYPYNGAEIDGSDFYYATGIMQTNTGETCILLGTKYKFIKSDGKSWVQSTTVPADLNYRVSTLRSIPPLNTFINLGVKQIPGGFVLSGYVNVQKYFSEDANERSYMAQLFPRASTELRNHILSETYEHDIVTIKRAGKAYNVTNVSYARWEKMTSRDMAALRGIPVIHVSPYLENDTLEMDETTNLWYATRTIKLPNAVKQALAGNSVTGTVYGTNG